MLKLFYSMSFLKSLTYLKNLILVWIVLRVLKNFDLLQVASCPGGELSRRRVVPAARWRWRVSGDESAAASCLYPNSDTFFILPSEKFTNSIKLVHVERPFMNPCWFDKIKLDIWYVKKVVTRDSNSFLKVDKKAIPREFSILFLFPVLKIGTI